MLLSILIPSLTSRAHYLAALRSVLDPQLTPDVEVLTDVDQGESSIGLKRNRLIEAAQGGYTAFVDDDDWISPDYVASVLGAAQTFPDVITFNMKTYHDGELKETGLAHLHLCPIKREIARRFKFPETNLGEDEAWARYIKPELKTQVYIDAVLYRYLYRTNRQGEVTNESSKSDYVRWKSVKDMELRVKAFTGRKQ